VVGSHGAGAQRNDVLQLWTSLLGARPRRRDKPHPDSGRVCYQEQRQRQRQGQTAESPPTWFSRPPFQLVPLGAGQLRDHQLVRTVDHRLELFGGNRAVEHHKIPMPLVEVRSRLHSGKHGAQLVDSIRVALREHTPTPRQPVENLVHRPVEEHAADRGMGSLPHAWYHWFAESGTSKDLSYDIIVISK